MTVSPDFRLGERYTLLDPVAAGGMGEVWRARDDVLGRTVAVKLLHAGFAGDADQLRRFRNEARSTAALSHPGIAGIFDYGESGGLAYLVMELVSGDPLSAVLRCEGPLPPGRAMDIVGQSALALQAAHQAGVVHRDVKPANILIRPDGVVKLTDFGIARTRDAAGLTGTGTVLGTAQYLSPEQASGAPATPASDIYALGLVAYECLTGRPPFDAETPMAVALAQVSRPLPPLPAAVPEPVRDLVHRALAKDPADRWPDAAEFGRRALALSRRFAGLPAAAGPPAAAAAAAAPGPARETAAGRTATLPGPPAPPPTRPLRAGEPSRRKVRLAFFGIGAVVVLGGFLALRTFAAAAEVRVPHLVGDARAAALKALKHDGLAVRWSVASSPSVRAGLVSHQQPAPGTIIGQGATVRLTISSGPPTVAVDQAAYLGRPYSVVGPALERLGLHVREVIRPIDEVSPATVLSVAPNGTVVVGTTVTVTVAGAVPPPTQPPGPPRPPSPPGADRHKGHHHGD